MNQFDTILESLWANINKKRKSGKKSAKKVAKLIKLLKNQGINYMLIKCVKLVSNEF